MCRKGLKMPNIRKTPTKIIGFRVRDDMLEFFNSLENKNDFLVGLVAGCSAFKDFKRENVRDVRDKKKKHKES